MLATAVDDFPATGRELFYEPKFDGFRVIVCVHEDGGVHLYSRNRTRLTAAFPETAAAIRQYVPPGTVLDGELVHWNATTGQLDFTALQRRLRAGTRRAADLARREPVTLVAFDCLHAPGHGGLRNRPLRERRRALEDLLRDVPPDGLVLLCPQVNDRGRARLWLELLPAQRIEGLVVKPADGVYRPGVRGWYKLKHRDVTTAICGGYVGPPERPQSLIIGRHPSTGGRLRVVGHTTAPPPDLRAELDAELARRTPAAEDHPWPAELPASWFGGLPAARPPTPYTRVTPTLVVEVAVDIATSHGRWRHLARLQDVRGDLRPTDVPKDLDLE
ncbi:ATP-dependent DNA ligase [Actinomadura miaoliensis]